MILRVSMLVMFCGLAAGVVRAQEISVVERTTLQPVADATVLVLPTGQSALTSRAGRATLPPGTPSDTIVIQHVGFHPLRVTRADIVARGGTVRMIERLLNMEEVVVAANKWEQKRDQIPNQIVTVAPRDIAFVSPQTVPDMLATLGGVFVQKSQMGGGSPVLRGFEANRVLLVVDGVRLNNAIYRSGHLQSAVSLDAGQMENAEVIFGPGSTMYGSDAIGGVMDFHTRAPRLGWDGETQLGANAFVRHSTANSEKTGHVDLNLGFRTVALMTSVTWSDFGDLRAGNIRNPFYADWGRRPFSVERRDGADVVVANDNVNLQRGSAYSQLNLLGRLRWQPSVAYTVDYGFHLSTSSDVPRYDRLTETSATGVPSYADWRYGPQNWMMNTLTIAANEGNVIFGHGRLILAHQSIAEDRISRRFGRSGERHQEERVDVVSVNLDMDRELDGGHRLFYGAEAVFNDVASQAYSIDVNTGARTGAATRYPDGGSSYRTLAAYLSSQWMLGERVTASAGARYSTVHLASVFDDTTYTRFPFREAVLDNSALTGSLGAVVRAGRGWTIGVNTSSGFRAPNVDDVGKVFDSSPGTVIVPNPSLRSEYAWNAELSVGRRISDMLDIGATYFATLLTDAIVVRDGTFNGRDSLLYNDVQSRVQMPVNTNRAFVTGASVHVVADVSEHVTLAGNVTWTRGRDETDGVPLDHIPPLYGQVRLVHHLDRFRGEASLVFNGWKHLSDYSPGGEDNLQYATVHGTPAWYVLHLRASYQLLPSLQLQLALENVLDVHYRVFASGISAPGRNLVTTLRATL